MLRANMTGNVVFLGFALRRVPRVFSITASLAAVAAFGIGALLGGLVGARYSAHRGHLFRLATALQARILGGRCPAGRLQQHPHDGRLRLPCLIVVLAISMGIQNAAAL